MEFFVLKRISLSRNNFGQSDSHQKENVIKKVSDTLKRSALWKLIFVETPFECLTNVNKVYLLRRECVLDDLNGGEGDRG